MKSLTKYFIYLFLTLCYSKNICGCHTLYIILITTDTITPTRKKKTLKRLFGEKIKRHIHIVNRHSHKHTL